jgi:alginate O-acetyltransferase complex protein AlgI
MSFQSPYFFFFFLAVFGLYYTVRSQYRWVVLLGASVVFYSLAATPWLLIPLGLVIAPTYYCGIRVGKEESENGKKWWMVAGVGFNALILLFFRFYPLVSSLFAASGMISLISTIGVSFYVFQAISYLVDIYLDKIQAERHLGLFALYIAFFPKILQGPIERGRDLLPQLHRQSEFSYENARSGAVQFTYGLFKKVVIADRLGVVVDPIYGNVSGSSGVLLMVATFIYAFQLYYDFSGYTDMALGLARVFNLELTPNFHLPYLATSISEFWRRWHISFSRWIMDYWFKPIQLSLRNWKTWGGTIALIVTFLLSGLWHGASWGFIVWGLIHGIYLSVDAWYRPYRKKLYKRWKLDRSRWARVWQIVITFCLVSFSWIFFRASSIQDAFLIVRKTVPWRILDQNYYACGTNLVNYFFTMITRSGSNELRTLAKAACQVPRAEFNFFAGEMQPENVIITLAAILVAILLGIYWERLTSPRNSGLLRWAFYFMFAGFILMSVLFLQIPNPASAPFLYGIF